MESNRWAWLCAAIAVAAIGAAAQQPPIRCKIRLPEQFNEHQPTILPLLSPDGTRLYVDRKHHPQNTGGVRDPDEIWYADRLPDGSWSPLRNLGPPLNTPGSDVLCALSPDGTQALVFGIYRPDGTKQSGFSISHWTDSGWSFPQPLRIRNFYNLSQHYYATWSPDRRVLILSLQRLDSYGGLDLYVSFYDSLSGEWSEPLNMGNVLNTSGMEGSPFLAPDGRTLYFFSTGHRGFGGMDLFVSRRLDESWQRWSLPVNLGPEVNTSGDEASISLTVRGDTAYIVSVDPLTRQPGLYAVCLADSLRPLPVTLPARDTLPAASLRLFFAFNQWLLSSSERQRLREFLARMSIRDIAAVRVEGHTDDVGSERYNMWLSRKRAEAVAAELVRLGVPAERIQTIGYGSRQPAVTGRSPQARQQNRRVELTVLRAPPRSAPP
jgi:outer membrane protein OmpA-like peptidoglycan-associated protein